MTKRFLSGLAVLLTCAGSAAIAQTTETAADKDNPTAYTALRLVSKTLGRDALDRVVEVDGRNGVPQPYLWKIVLKEGTGSKEIDVTGGKIASQRSLDRPPVSSVPVKLADLNLDSSGAFDAIDVQARKVKLRYDSLDYTLRVSPETGKPVWTIRLLDQGGSSVGTARLAAHDGSTLSTEGRLANNPTLPADATVAATTTTTTAVRTHPAPPVVREQHTATTTTTVRRTTTATNLPPPLVSDRPLTTTTTNTPQDIPVATLSDRGDGNQEETETSVSSSSSEGGGLFTRAGRTLDHTSHTVEKHLRRAGGKVQRFFTGGRSGEGSGGDVDVDEDRD